MIEKFVDFYTLLLLLLVYLILFFIICNYMYMFVEFLYKLSDERANIIRPWWHTERFHGSRITKFTRHIYVGEFIYLFFSFFFLSFTWIFFWSRSRHVPATKFWIKKKYITDKFAVVAIGIFKICNFLLMRIQRKFSIQTTPLK